ncbi:uncharacterized protein LOC129300160 [Prosopis cineraria]|uniref:uncharacterized protein LOC129300160 n=1 Tax=Prosopis cineraria TaxID=364024 RepID=UPI00240F9913|nr:uncharacterized protein LOC129300160 [Prosopis cineraria]
MGSQSFTSNHRFVSQNHRSIQHLSLPAIASTLKETAIRLCADRWKKAIEDRRCISLSSIAVFCSRSSSAAVRCSRSLFATIRCSKSSSTTIHCSRSVFITVRSFLCHVAPSVSIFALPSPSPPSPKSLFQICIAVPDL